MNKQLQILSVFLVTIFALTSAANAQIRAGAHVGFDTDSSDLFAGINATIPVTEVGDKILLLNPEGSYWVTGDGFSLFIISVNVLYPLTTGSLSAYAGGGIAISFFSFDTGDFGEFGDLFGLNDISTSSTDFGLNIKGGAELGEGGMRPFGEVGYFLKDGGFLYLQGGIRIQVGGE